MRLEGGKLVRARVSELYPRLIPETLQPQDRFGWNDDQVQHGNYKEKVQEFPSPVRQPADDDRAGDKEDARCAACRDIALQRNPERETRILRNQQNVIVLVVEDIRETSASYGLGRADRF